MNTEIIDAGRDISGGYKVDVSRGTNVDRVSSEWFSRPDDERYLSLDDLFASVKGRAERSRTRTVESAAIRVEAHRDNPEKLGLVLPDGDEPIAPTHWSFGQLSSLVGAPAAYLRQLPAPLAGINLQYGLTNHRAEQIKTMEVADGRTELRAVTGPDYGRIYDHELVSAVQRIAGNGTGDTRWKVPGVLDWSTGIYNPRVDVTKETTTLYASDRDVFLFLVDDLNPIEAGLLPDGSPDLYFRGFYCWNSEVGAKTLGIASFYLRAVCQIRAATLAMGGDWHDLGGELTEGAETTVLLQPLARIDDPAERSWAAGWIGAILAREGIAITPEVKEHLWSALSSLASAPVGERTITGLAVLLQSSDLKQALRPYCLGGAHGRLLDAEIEELGAASVQVFEIEGLVGTAAAPAVLSYLFHRIGDRLDGRPTLLIIDEGWLALDDEGFAGQLREWLKTLRKKNASVIFATQSLSDIDASAIAPAIIESCPTRLLLPNERAIEPQITAIYRRFGLNDRQIEILARATPKRDYYCQSRRGNRLFELGLSEVGLALCAASSKSDQTLISDILVEHGREGFLAAWLEARGVGWAAELIPDLTNLAPEPEAPGAPIPQAPEPAEETTP